MSLSQYPEPISQKYINEDENFDDESFQVRFAHVLSILHLPHQNFYIIV